MNFLFGKTFWSTVISSALLLPLLSVISFPLVLIFGSADNIATLQRTTPVLWIVHLILSLILGSWAGWGFAYWRFQARPVGKGWFAAFPLLSGFVFGPLAFWALIEGLPASEHIEAGEKTTAMIFGAIAVPPEALLMSLFWRYALSMTALKRYSSRRA